MIFEEGNKNGLFSMINAAASRRNINEMTEEESITDQMENEAVAGLLVGRHYHKSAPKEATSTSSLAYSNILETRKLASLRASTNGPVKSEHVTLPSIQTIFDNMKSKHQGIPPTTTNHSVLHLRQQRTGCTNNDSSYQLYQQSLPHSSNNNHCWPTRPSAINQAAQFRHPTYLTPQYVKRPPFSEFSHHPTRLVSRPPLIHPLDNSNSHHQYTYQPSLAYHHPPPSSYHHMRNNHSVNIQRTPVMPSNLVPDTPGFIRQCANCDTKDTPSWRRCGVNQAILCNACGLYYNEHGRHRQFRIGADGKTKAVRQSRFRLIEGDHCPECEARKRKYPDVEMNDMECGSCLYIKTHQSSDPTTK